MPALTAIVVLLLACSAPRVATPDGVENCDTPVVADGPAQADAGCVDEDGDTFGAACLPGPDCDDSNPAVSPAGIEVCNRLDDDCDGEADLGCPWALRAGGSLSGFDWGKAVALLPDGDLVATGYFGGEATFESIRGEGATLALDGVGMFLVRYDASGRFRWALAVDAAVGLSVAATPDGGVVVAGRFGGDSATFGAGEVTETSLANAGIVDVFVAKYDGDGSLVWAKRAGGAGYDQATGVAVLPDGGVLVTGSFDGGTFGPGEDGETTLSTAAKGDIFLLRLDSDGELVWVRTAGGANQDLGLAVSAHPDASALVTGGFHETATFGPGEAGETTVADYIGAEMFVAKFGPDGSLLWARSAQALSVTDAGYGIAATPEGGALVTGILGGTVTFSPGHPDETVLETAGADVFLARYGPAGNIEWVKLAGGDGRSSGGNAVAILPDGGSMVAGFFYKTSTFGRGEPGETTLTSPSDQADLFVARFAPDGSLAWADRAGTATWNPPWAAANGVTVLADGSPIVTGAFDSDVTFFEGQPYEVVLGEPDAIGSDILLARFPADGPP